MKWGMASSGMVLLFGLVLGCEQLGTEGDGHFTAYRVTAAGAAAPDAWTRLSGPDQRLVSPVFSPTGQFLMARGWGGVGLLVLSAPDGAVLFRDPGYRGPLRFAGPGVLHLGAQEAAREIRWAPETGEWRSAKRPAALDPAFDELLGTRVGGDGTHEVFHHAYDGTITLVDQNHDQILVEDRGAWGLAVTADGQRVAYSLGSLTEPRLLIYDPEGGLRELGAGTQPVWLPGGRTLIFAAPSDGPTTRTERGYATDLFVFDLETSQVQQLTDTPAIAEMEPAVSPDGRSLAFADWNAGALYLAPLPALPGVRPAGEGVAP